MSLRFSINVRIIFLSFSNVFIKNLYIKILHLLLSIFLKINFFHNFVNNKTRFAFFNVIKIMKFESIYIDIYLIQICQVK